MAAESRSRYGRSIDLALFTEYAVTAGKPGPAAEVAVPLDDTILDALGSKAREHKTYIVFGGVFRDIPATAACSNAAVVIDRKGRLAGRYVKVHPVLDRVGPDGKIVLEGGVRPGAEYNVLDLDFGRVGVQICYDVEYPEGWRRLAEQGRRAGALPDAIPAAHPPRDVRRHPRILGRLVHVPEQRVLLRAGTGLVAAQITEPKQTLVQEIDLSYLILPWSSRLRNGEAFREAFGDRVGYRYSESEDRGVFWSNDPNRSIGEMARSLGLLETATEQQARARDAQDRLRGGPAADHRFARSAPDEMARLCSSSPTAGCRPDDERPEPRIGRDWTGGASSRRRWSRRPGHPDSPAIVSAQGAGRRRKSRQQVRRSSTATYICSGGPSAG